MDCNSLKDLASPINFSKIISKQNLIKNIKKLNLNSSFNKKKEQVKYPLTNRVKINQKYFSPIKINNYKLIENYLLSSSLLTKKNNSETHFDIDYFKNISRKNSPIISKNTILGRKLTNNVKETYKKNILIDMIKKKREEISKFEKDIQFSFRLRKKEIDNHFNNFSMIKNEYKIIQRKEDKIMKYYELQNQKIRSIYYREKINNKRLRDTIEKTIRDIFKLKEYSDFINKIYNLSYALEKINDNLFYGNKIEIIKQKIIDLYNDEEMEKETFKQNRILKDIQLFVKNFYSFEDKIIQLLKEKETIINEIYLIKNENKNKLKYLIKRKKNYESDENSIMNLKISFIKDNKIQTKENKYFKDFLTYITQLSKILDISVSNHHTDDTILDYLKYSKEILDILKNKERIIDKYTKEIENLTNSENKNEKLMIEKIISTRRKENLIKKQSLIKQINEKKIELNKIKTLNKIKKKIIKGRILIDYKNINSPKKKVEKKIEVHDDDDNNNLIYCFSEDDKI